MTDTLEAHRPVTASRNAPMVVLDDLVRVFGRGEGEVRALDGVTLALERGTFAAVMCPSGSGKSTLLQLAAGLDRPTSGRVRLGERDLADMNERALVRLRREHLGFVFQSFNLLAALTAEQNVALPSRLAGRPGWGACRSPPPASPAGTRRGTLRASTSAARSAPSTCGCCTATRAPCAAMPSP
jgi:ABC-type sugar transport system ATPase subunit